MKIEKLAENKIKLTVTEEDMASLGINLKTILTDAPQMRSFFHNIMKKAEKEAGFCTDDSRLMIEAHPYEFGGIVLFVTNLDKEKSHVHTRRIRAKAKSNETGEEISVFEFDTFEDICSFVKNCYNMYRGGTLYFYDDKYYLAALRTIHPLVFEYARKIYEEPLFEAMLMEHGKCIIKENAIDVIDQYFE